MYGLSQKLVAEWFGTFAVVFIAAGSICADPYVRSAGQSSGGLLGSALAYGLAVAIMVGVIGPVSGAHLNPAITVGFWVTKRLGTLQTLLYVVAQLVGAVTAAYLLVAIVPESVWRPVALGTPDLAPDFTRIHGMLLEGVLTFIFVFVYFASTEGATGASQEIAGFSIGLTITTEVLVGAPFTGASMNPARTLGTALAAHHWTNHGVYWIGPLFGGVLAGVFYDRLFLRDQPPAA